MQASTSLLPEPPRAAKAAWHTSNPCGLQHKTKISNMLCMLHSTTTGYAAHQQHPQREARSHLAVAGASPKCCTLHGNLSSQFGLDCSLNETFGCVQLI